ncbi:MFS transporter [Alteromonas oceanisediminis]|uniref:MFS transporter n=1 Tax=Alteromonas oceanisediminis TaxID=2836180 RepID=UPI001BD93D5C|nr:MFS transporter [Alteromonas oceanisediminis]MBT0586152.1 MFS transporter [Alteromonas oceanisediminis]
MTINRSAKVMLALLTFFFILSHAFRTIVPIVAQPLATELSLSPNALGLLAGCFHLAFALAQPVVGVSLDFYGAKRTVVVFYLLVITGSCTSVFASSFSVLVVGQLLIGIGCAPALLASLVFITHHFPSHRFTALSAVVLSLGGAGMLVTSSPLAWVVSWMSWRSAFVVLAILSVISWVAIICIVKEKPLDTQSTTASLRATVFELSDVFKQQGMLGICCLAATSYAAFLCLRGLWLGPMLTSRYGLTTANIGHVALLLSIAAMLGPLIFGLVKTSPYKQRLIIISFGCCYSLLFVLHAIQLGLLADIVLIVLNGLMGGFIALQYADLRAAFSADKIGRALSIFTIAMFLGVALSQWISGFIASLAASINANSLYWALLFVALLQVLGVFAFWYCQWPCRIQRHKAALRTEPS